MKNINSSKNKFSGLLKSFIILLLKYQVEHGNEVIRSTFIEYINELYKIELKNYDLHSLSGSETAYNLVKRLYGESSSIESFYDQAEKSLTLFKRLEIASSQPLALWLKKYLV